MILTIFNLQVALILPTKFESIGLLVQEMKRKIDFQNSSYLIFLIITISAIFDLQDTPILLTKF